MGIAVGDYDNSGRWSLFVTNFAEEYNNLFRNEGNHFTDVAFKSKTGASSLPYVGWGTEFVDLDNDGWQDIIVGNGHVYPQLDKGSPWRFGRVPAAPPAVQERGRRHIRGNRGSPGTGAHHGARQPRCRIGGFDNDGRVDVVIADLDGSPQVLHNQVRRRRQLVDCSAQGCREEHYRRRG